MMISALINSLEYIYKNYGDVEVEMKTTILGKVSSFTLSEVIVRGIDTNRPYASIISREEK